MLFVSNPYFLIPNPYSQIRVSVLIRKGDNSPRINPGASRPKPDVVAPTSKCSERHLGLYRYATDNKDN